MVTPAQLLPSNSTALERAIANTAPRTLLDALADAPRRLKSTPPDAVVPWLAAEWGLADFTAYFASARALIEAGLPWLQLRGTAAAVKLALSWIGLQAMLEEDGTRLQLDPGTAQAPDNLAAIRHLVEASIPAHVQLYRLYHGYDRRVLRASTGDRWSDAFLSDDSGVWVNGIKLSFGRLRHLQALRAETLLTLRLTRLHAARVLYPDVMRWGDFYFGDVPVLNHPITHGRLIGVSNSQGLRNPLGMRGLRRMARAALPLSEDAKLGEPNTRFGGYSETASNRFMWSDRDSNLSDFDPGRVRTPIEEVWLRAHADSAAAPIGLGLMGPNRTSAIRLRGIHCNRDLPNPWAGSWNTRRWGGYLSLTHKTLTT